MILYKIDLTEVKVFKSKRPKFGKRCCWSDETIYIDDIKTTIFWECMRGQNYYFELNGEWKRIPFFVGKKFNQKDNLNDVTHVHFYTSKEIIK